MDPRGGDAGTVSVAAAAQSSTSRRRRLDRQNPDIAAKAQYNHPKTAADHLISDPSHPSDAPQSRRS
jgi:hypothetical protein